MRQLRPLSPEDAPEVLAFEVANRAYFAKFISDRGDAFFDEFTQRFDELLAEIATGRVANYVLPGDDRSVLGRFNLVDIADSTAELGYRIAERVAGRGVATAGVRQLCALAASVHGVRTLRARTTLGNVASQRVLSRAGFSADGPAEIGGQAGTWYELPLPRPGA